MDLIDVVAAQMHDDARDPEDPNWSILREEQRDHWRRRARNVLRAAAEHFEREGDKVPATAARTLHLAVADQLRPV